MSEARSEATSRGFLGVSLGDIATASLHYPAPRLSHLIGLRDRAYLEEGGCLGLGFWRELLVVVVVLVALGAIGVQTTSSNPRNPDACDPTPPGSLIRFLEPEDAIDTKI